MHWPLDAPLSNRETITVRILMVTNHFFPSVGGLELAAQRLATALANKGIKVSILTPRYKGLSKSELVGKIPVRRFLIIRSPHVRYDFFSKLVYAVSLGSRLIRERREYDLIHVHQALYAAVVSLLVAKLLRKKIIVKVAGSGANGNIRVLKGVFWGGGTLFSLLAHADIFISLSQETNQELLAHGIAENKIRNIPNGINIVDFDAIADPNIIKQRLGIQQSKFIGIFVGRLGMQKHVIKLIHAWKSIVQADSDAVLLVAGDGPDREKLAEAVRHENLGNRVLFLGNVANVKELLNISDIFILPSDSEGMSNALLEAQAAGVPCVASREDGNISMISEGATGLLFDLFDIEDIKAKILFIKNNPGEARKFAIAAKEEVKRRYRIENVADSYTELYQQLLN